MTSKHKMEEEKLDANSISFIALCHRYCVTLESLADEATDSDDFCRSMLYMLPRLYMTAFDLGMSGDDISDYRDADSGDSVNEVLDENAYTIVRDNIAAIMGSHDTFLETNVEDMMKLASRSPFRNVWPTYTRARMILWLRLKSCRPRCFRSCFPI